jgi:hypothetical protein
MKDKGLGSSRLDPHGHAPIFFGSDAPVGAPAAGVVDGSALAADLEPGLFGVGTDRTPSYFHIIPEVDPAAAIADVGTITVQLVDQGVGETFLISAKQLLAYAGQAMPYRIARVYKTGTTEDFSIIW